jgi:hypothetical protein
VWDFSKHKHEECDDPTDLKLQVSKLINIVSSKAPHFHFKTKEECTYAEVQRITLEGAQNLKSHWIKMLCINKVAHAYKNYILFQEPNTLNTDTNTARVMRKQKNVAGHSLTKIKDREFDYESFHILY